MTFSADISILEGKGTHVTAPWDQQANSISQNAIENEYSDMVSGADQNPYMLYYKDWNTKNAPMTPLVVRSSVCTAKRDKKVSFLGQA